MNEFDGVTDDQIEAWIEDDTLGALFERLVLWPALYEEHGGEGGGA